MYIYIYIYIYVYIYIYIHIYITAGKAMMQPDDADALAATICAQHGVDARYPCPPWSRSEGKS